MCPLLFIMFDSHQKNFKPNNGPSLAGDTVVLRDDAGGKALD